MRGGTVNGASRKERLSDCMTPVSVHIIMHISLLYVKEIVGVKTSTIEQYVEEHVGKGLRSFM